MPQPCLRIISIGLIEAIPVERHLLMIICRYAVLEFEELLDSSSIDSRGWTQIAQTIYRNYKLFDGFVVLHGTDSLAYTCSALSFMLQHLGKPVILTGKWKHETSRWRLQKSVFLNFSELRGGRTYLHDMPQCS
jgi:hypothetical protein